MITKLVKFMTDFEKCINDIEEDYSNLAILCVGTNKIIGDSIGPIIGSNLKHMENDFMHVFGTTCNPLDFYNARNIINNLYENYEKPYIITIDAALSDKNRKGEIVLNKGFIKIGKALDRSICFYSNTNINCVVGKNSEYANNNLEELLNADEKRVYEMSKIVSTGIKNVLKKVNIYV